MRLTAYLGEIAVGWRLTDDLGSFIRLLNATVLWHLNNGLHRWDRDSRHVAIRVRIDGHVQRLQLRPFAGDLFVFYEVFGSGCYFVPASLVDPSTVRTIVDLGANVGLTSLYLASRYAEARIVSVEPDPANYSLLKNNVDGHIRISPVHAAITGAPQPSVFLSQDSASWGNRTRDLAGHPNDVEVPAITIDGLMREHGLDTIDVLKVDIEGAEATLFARPQFLERVRFVIIELHGTYTVETLRRDIGPLGFLVSPGRPGGPIMVTASRAAGDRPTR